MTLSFAHGETVRADAVIAADGVNSLVKKILFGESAPNFTGRIAYRTVYPTARLGVAILDDCAKWWGPDRHIIIYYVKPDRSELYFVTSQPEPGFEFESWSATGDVGALSEAFAEFHPQVRGVIAASTEVFMRPLVDREPMARGARATSPCWATPAIP